MTTVTSHHKHDKMEFIKSKKQLVFCFLIFSELLLAQQPSINSFAPVYGSPGATVTITGTNFTGATAVSFGDIPASSFLVNSSTSITAVVGQGGTGAVKITTASGIATLPGFALVRNICPGGNTVFTSNISGTSYQWQVNKGSGFINLADNSNYSGTKTINLNLITIPSSWYGYQYRCYVDGSISMVVTLRFSVSWNGSATTAWENSLNWSCGILPDSNTDIIINSGATNLPVISSNSSCRSMTVNNSIVTINSGNILSITGTENAGDAVINESVYLIDSVNMPFTSTQSMIDQGIYEYSSSDSLPNFTANDIIVGIVNEGYIRKISSVEKEPGKIILHTSPGQMESVFNKAKLNFNMNTDESERINSAQSGNTYTFNNLTLFDNGSITIRLDNGTINFDPNWKFDFDFKGSKLDHFEASCQNATLTSSFKVTINANQAVTLFDQTVTLKRFSKILLVPIPGILIPVMIKMDLDFIGKYSGSLDASLNRSAIFTSTSTMNLGIKYENGTWQPVYNLTNNPAISPIPATGENNVIATINVAIIPTVNIKLFGFIGPYASIGLHKEFKAGVASPSLDWDFSIADWIHTELGINANAFGESLFDHNTQWNTDAQSYKTPYSIMKISGDNQLGQSNQFLSQPIKIRVRDNFNDPQSNVPVYFSVTAGGGSVQNVNVLTDNDGYAQTLWQLGSQFGLQYVEATAKKADGSLLQNAPVEFAAIVNELPTLTTTSINSVTMTTASSGGNITNDGGTAVIARGVCWNTSPNPIIANSKTIDGTGIGIFTSNMTGLTSNTLYYVRAYATNSLGTGYGNELSFTTNQGDSTFTDPRDGQIYTFRHIGSQVWMTKNLNYVTATGSFCQAANPANCSTYGRLYNWSTALTVAPPGWHLPSDAEWTTLTTYLGGQTVAGGAMKDTIGWNPPNTGATNSSGFSGRPGGLFIYGIGYASLGNVGYWWSSTGDTADQAWYRVLGTFNTNAGRGSNLKVDGFSVRCIRDY